MCMDPASMAMAAAGMGLQMWGASKNQKAQERAMRDRMRYATMGRDQLNQNFDTNYQQFQETLPTFSPETALEQIGAETDRIGGSINQNVLEANLAFGGTGRPSGGEEYERAYARYVADDAERTMADAQNYARLIAPAFVSQGQGAELQRMGADFAVRGGSAQNQAGIATSAGQLVQPRYNPWVGLASAAGGALTTKGLGDMFAAGWNPKTVGGTPAPATAGGSGASWGSQNYWAPTYAGAT